MYSNPFLSYSQPKTGINFVLRPINLCNTEREQAENVIRRAVGALDRNHDKRREAFLLDTTGASSLSGQLRSDDNFKLTKCYAFV